MSPFKDCVIEVVKAIPYGRVVSYGQVALYIGMPRSARQVGWVLNGTEGKINLPWWRVINHEGRISIAGTKYNDKLLQKKLLEAEGVIVSDDLIVDMTQYRFLADQKFLARFSLSREYLEMLIEKHFV